MSSDVQTKEGEEGQPDVDGKRRTLLKAGLGAAAALLLAYLLWPSIDVFLRGKLEEPPEVVTKPPSTTQPPPSSPKPTATETMPPSSAPPTTIPPGEVSWEFPPYPADSPLDSPVPFLKVEPVAIASSTTESWDYAHLSVWLGCSNLGGAPSAAFIEVLHVKEELSFPLNLSSFCQHTSLWTAILRRSGRTRFG